MGNSVTSFIIFPCFWAHSMGIVPVVSPFSLPSCPLHRGHWSHRFSGCHRRWQLVLQLGMGFPKSLSHWAHGRWYNDGHALADRDLDSGFGLWILIIVTSAARSSLWSYVASCGLQMVQSFCSWDAWLNQEVRHEEQPGVPPWVDPAI